MAIRPFVDRPSPRETLPIGGACTGQRVAVPVVARDADAAVDQTRLAMSVATGNDGCVHIVDPSGDRDPLYVDTTSEREDETLERVRAFCDTEEIDSGMLSGRRTTRRVTGYVREHEVDTLVLPGGLDGGSLGSRRHNRLAMAAPCDVISINGQGRYRDFASMLVPTAGGPHAGLAIDVAARVAESLDAWIDILHVLPEDPDEATVEAAEDQLTAAADRIGRPGTVNPWFLRSDDPADTIIEQSTYYGLTVIGAPTSSRLRRFVYGSTSREIRREAESVVIAARTPENE